MQLDGDFEFEILNNSPPLNCDDKRKWLLLLKTTEEIQQVWESGRLARQLLEPPTCLSCVSELTCTSQISQ